MTDAPSADDLRAAVRRGLRVSRLVDPYDNTIPFFKADNRLVWVSDKQALDTIVHEILVLWADDSGG